MTDKLDLAIVDALRTEGGRRIFMWFLEMASVYSDPFAGDGASEATAYTIGRQSGGRRVILRLNEIDPRLYPQLLFDAAAIRDADQRAEERSEEEDDDNA